MNVRPSILCPIDGSDVSAGALRYAAAIAEHFVTRLIVMTVKSRVRAPAHNGGGGEWARQPSAPSEAAVAAYVSTVFAGRVTARALCEYEVATGDPAIEILRVARERSCDLIVMASDGSNGARTWPPGSTTERVLRVTPVPVLVTPPGFSGDVELEALGPSIGSIIAPVDLSSSSDRQVTVASALAESLALPLVLVHVLQHTGSGPEHDVDPDRRRQAARALAELDSRIAARCRRETLVESGDPAAAIASVARQRHAGLIVMGLHDSPRLGQRMGSVTYRTLCLAPTVVLALPPRRAAQPVVETRMAEFRSHQ